MIVLISDTQKQEGVQNEARWSQPGPVKRLRVQRALDYTTEITLYVNECAYSVRFGLKQSTIQENSLPLAHTR